MYIFIKSFRVISLYLKCMLVTYLRLCLKKFILMVNFMTLNVNGLRDQLKRQALLTWLSSRVPSSDIVCLQETHSTSDVELQSWFGGSSYSFLGTHSSNHSAGVCILFKPCFSSYNCHQHQSGRLVVVDFKSVFHDFRCALCLCT